MALHVCLNVENHCLTVGVEASVDDPAEEAVRSADSYPETGIRPSAGVLAQAVEVSSTATTS